MPKFDEVVVDEGLELACFSEDVFENDVLLNGIEAEDSKKIRNLAY